MGPLAVYLAAGQGVQEVTGIGRAHGIWREPVWPRTVTEEQWYGFGRGQIVQSLEDHNKDFGHLPKMVSSIEAYEARERHDRSQVYENHDPSGCRVLSEKGRERENLGHKCSSPDRNYAGGMDQKWKSKLERDDLSGTVAVTHTDESARWDVGSKKSRVLRATRRWMTWQTGEMGSSVLDSIMLFPDSLFYFLAICSKKKKACIYKEHFLTVLHSAETFVHILMARVPLPVRFTTLCSEPAATPGWRAGAR